VNPLQERNERVGYIFGFIAALFVWAVLAIFFVSATAAG
jgi:hypothetical protein